MSTSYKTINTYDKDDIHQEATVFGVVANSHDKAEGTKAFVEQRHPVFTRS